MTALGTWEVTRPLEFGKGRVAYAGDDFEIIEELEGDEVLIRMGSTEFRGNLSTIQLSAAKKL